MKKITLGILTLALIIMGVNLSGCLTDKSNDDGDPPPCIGPSCQTPGTPNPTPNTPPPEVGDAIPDQVVCEDDEIELGGECYSICEDGDIFENGECVPVEDDPDFDPNLSEPDEEVFIKDDKPEFDQEENKAEDTTQFDVDELKGDDFLSLMDYLCGEDNSIEKIVCQVFVELFMKSVCIDVRGLFEKPCVRNVVNERLGKTEGESFEKYEESSKEQYLYRENSMVTTQNIKDSLESTEDDAVDNNVRYYISDEEADGGYSIENVLSNDFLDFDTKLSDYTCEIINTYADCLVVSEGKMNCVANCIAFSSYFDNFDYDGCITDACEASY